ncbi:MAG: hypothetical protein AAGI30_07225 [Planctomycetota bacterium]
MRTLTLFNKDMTMVNQIVLIGVLCVALSARAVAAIINVPADQATIQQAIDAAANGDEIVIAQGTYFEHLNLLGKEITLRSTEPDDPAVVQATIIDGGNDRDLPDFPQNPGSTVVANSGETLNTRLVGLTITGGYAGDVATESRGGTSGGGVRVFSVDDTGQFVPTTITLDRCRFVKNDALRNGGGVVVALGSAPVITDCVFLNNRVGGSSSSIEDGGGLHLFVPDETVTITNCEFNGNSSGRNGGGVSGFVTTIVFDTCTFTDNSSSSGGAVFQQSSGGTFVSCTFRSNTSTAQGGAVQLFAAGASFTDCVFEENTGLTEGGAISSGGGGTTLSIIGGAFRRNTGTSGGAINRSGFTDISGAVFEQNSAIDGSGGGVFVSSGGAAITDSIFDRNTSTDGGGGARIGGGSEITNNTFTGNEDTTAGGGIRLAGGVHLVHNNLFDGNLAIGEPGRGAGGAIELNGSAIIERNTIINNQAGGEGGGLDITRGSVPTRVSDNLFENNSAVQAGGGLFALNSGETVIIDHNRFIGNTSLGLGGGVYDASGFSAGGSPTQYVGNLIHGNTAESGGGVFASFSDSQFVSNVIVANTANIDGGGVYAECSAIDLFNPTLLENSAGNQGGSLFVECPFIDRDRLSRVWNMISFSNDASTPVNGPEVFLGLNSFSEINDSIIEDAFAVGIRDGGFAEATLTNLSDADPQFVDPDGADDDITTPADNDLSLMSTSPAIDLGVVTSFPLDPLDLDSDTDTAELLPIGDALGLRRVIGAAIDLGAFEFCVLNFDGINGVDAFDIGAFMNAVQAGGLDADINTSGAVNDQDVMDLLNGIQNADCDVL